MGAKKKGKGSKLARMSEEERLRYLQHRAAIEEEARRRKEQLIATFMKNKLKREEAFSRLNIAKINQQWRHTLRRYKCIELKQDLESLFKWFVHAASKKTNQIDNLLNDMEEAEVQYCRIYQCHMETIERLLDIHQQRIDFFQRQYEQDRNEIYEKATNEMKRIVSSCTLDQEHLEAILYRMKENHQMKAEKMEAKQTIKTDELRNNTLTELENLVVSREAKIEQLWQNMQKVLRDYWEGTEDRRRQYITLRDADFENCKQIFMFYQQINNTNELIFSLKDQLVRTTLNGEEKCAEMKKEKENCNQLFNVLRKHLVYDREKDKKNLIFLTVTAEDAIKELKRILQKGEQILQILSLCKKLEVLEDAINPYMAERDLADENKEEEAVEECSSKEKLAEDIVSNFSKLDKFWKRYNEVLIEKEVLTINIKSLEQEQKELKNSLKIYISDIMTGKPSTKQTRLIITRPLTCQVRRTSTALNQGKANSRVPYMEAIESPSIRQMIRTQSEK